MVKRFEKSLFLKKTIIAKLVPMCSVVSRSVDTSISINLPKSIRCPLLDIGSNSDIPCTTAKKNIFRFSIPPYIMVIF